MYSYEQKKQIYKRWLEQGRPWFSSDKSKDPDYIEKQVILEMLKQENAKAKYDKEIEKRTKQIRDKELEQRVKNVRERYGNKGLLSDKIFHVLDGY